MTNLNKDAFELSKKVLELLDKFFVKNDGWEDKNGKDMKRKLDSMQKQAIKIQKLFKP